jgi:hypothetical protein
MKTTRYRYLLQQKIEETFSKKFIIQKAVDDLLTSESIVNKLNKGVEILYSWFNENHGIDKSLRLLALQGLDINELVKHTVALVALHCAKPMKLVSIASMCIGHLKMADKVDAIQTMAEVIAMLSDTDLFDCRKTADGWVVVSRIGLDEEVLRYAYNAFYLPPMIIKPRTVRHNRDSGYITQRGESLILGYYENHHDDDICLDVLNILNANEYELDTDLISSLSEDPLEITVEQLQQNAAAKDKYLSYFNAQKKLKQILDTWDDYQTECYKLQTLMLYHANKFYLQNKVDKRGRIYTSGYHISPQGSSFKKAMINLAKKEIVTGLDTW